MARTIPGSAEAYAGILHRKRTRNGKAVIRQLAASGKALSLEIGGERAGSGGWLSVDLTAARWPSDIDSATAARLIPEDCRNCIVVCKTHH